MPRLEISPEPLLRQPQQPLMPEAPGMVFPESPPDLRTRAQIDIDNQILREITGYATPPTGPTMPRLEIAGGGKIPPDVTARHLRNIPDPEWNRMKEWARTAGLTTMDLMGYIRANVASFDISYPRQQALLIPANPASFARSFPKALKSVWSREYAEQVDHAISIDHPYIDLYNEMGVDFLRPLNFKKALDWQRAEDFIVLGGNRFFQRLAEKTPWINISSRAYITGINSMNWDIWKSYVNMLLRVEEKIATGQIVLKPREAFSFKKSMVQQVRGVLAEELALRPKETFSVKQSAKQLGNMLAEMSGRGPLGPLKTVSPALNSAFFSVRNNIGRLISPRHLFSGDRFTRREAWKNFMVAIGTFSGIILGGKQMGLWDVETDPRSSDFMKIRIGPTRIDIWGGYQQYVVLYGRLLPVVGGLKSVDTGKVSDYDPVNGVWRFARTKVAPAIAEVLTAWTGEDFKGSKIDRRDWQFWLKENMPLAVQDVLDAYGEHGLVGLAFGPPAALGIGASTFDLTKNDVARQLYGLEYDQLPERQRKIVREAIERQMTPEERLKARKERQESERGQKEREAERERQFRRDRPVQSPIYRPIYPSGPTPQAPRGVPPGLPDPVDFFKKPTPSGVR